VAFAYEHIAIKVGPVINSTKEFLGKDTSLRNVTSRYAMHAEVVLFEAA